MKPNSLLCPLLALAVLVAPAAAVASLAPFPSGAVPGMLASAHSGLGIVADGRRAGERGVVVVAVTPGSAGERMGVRVGDRLLAVNGRRLEGVLAPNALIGEALGDGGEVRLELERDGEALSLSGRAGDALATAPDPRHEGCGYVSTLGVPPRVSQGIFDAEITQINGRSTPLEPQNRYRLPAGRQVLVVREMIDRHRLGLADRHRIERMQRRERGGYRTLVVDVAPGTRYSIGARLLEDRLDPDSIRANAYWEPVVWESRPERCR